MVTIRTVSSHLTPNSWYFFWLFRKADRWLSNLWNFFPFSMKQSSLEIKSKIKSWSETTTFYTNSLSIIRNFSSKLIPHSSFFKKAMHLGILRIHADKLDKSCLVLWSNPRVNSLVKVSEDRQNNRTARFRNVNQCFNNIYSLLWTWSKLLSIFKCFSFSTPVLIRHLWQLKRAVFLHRCLICALLLTARL